MRRASLGYSGTSGGNCADPPAGTVRTCGVGTHYHRTGDSYCVTNSASPNYLLRWKLVAKLSGGEGSGDAEQQFWQAAGNRASARCR